MAVVQSKYGNMSLNKPISVWLVVDVPGRAAEKAEELEKALKEHAQQWLAEADKNINLGERYQIESGPAETSNLKVSVKVT